jgi:hypothetical protein
MKKQWFVVRTKQIFTNHSYLSAVMLTHCVGLTRYFIGTALAGRQVHRDRDAEFRARGAVAEIRQAVRELQ